MTDTSLAETPDQLTKRVDDLYLTLAHVYQRVGRVLGLSPPPIRKTPRHHKAVSHTAKRGARRPAKDLARKR